MRDNLGSTAVGTILEGPWLGAMRIDSLGRTAALAVLPVVAITAYWLERETPDAPGPAVMALASAQAPVEEAAVTEAEQEAEPREETPPLPAAPSASGAAIVRMVGDRVVTERLPVAPLPRKLLARDLPSTSEQPAPITHAPPAGTCGGVVARVVTASHDPAWSFASLSPSPTEPAMVHRVGDRVGGYTVAGIEWDRVWLAQGSSRCAVEVHPGFLGPAPSARATRSHARQSELAAAALLPAAIGEGIEKRSETEFSVLTRTVDAIFARGADLLGGVKLEPVRRQGSVAGIELDLVPADSLLERLGLESGDVLLAINDEPSASPDAALASLERARRAARMVARLERKGETFELEVRVQ